MRHVPKEGCDLALKLPIRTVSELNQAEHWRSRHRRRKDQKRSVGLFLNTCKRPRLPCDVWLTRIAPRQLDPGDNLNSSFKAIRDQIATWLGVDDGDTSKVCWRYQQRRGEPREYAVLIEIFGAEDDG